VSLFTHPSVLGFVWLAIVITAVVAFIDAMMRPMAAWIYAGENRNLWLAVTFAACVVPFVFSVFIAFISLGAAMFYLVDKKPKLAAYQPPRRKENDLHDNWR
jgi:Protein of unknown function (DUF2516)